MAFAKAKVKVQSNTCNLAGPRGRLFWSEMEYPRVTPWRTLKERGAVPQPSNELHDSDIWGVFKSKRGPIIEVGHVQNVDMTTHRLS